MMQLVSFSALAFVCVLPLLAHSHPIETVPALPASAPRPIPSRIPAQCMLLPTSLASETCSLARVCPPGFCCLANGRCVSSGGICASSLCQSQCNRILPLGLRPCNVPVSPRPVSFPQPAPIATVWRPSRMLPGGLFEIDSFGSYISCGFPGMMAITYDDGPIPEVTETILNTLRSIHTKTTFFWLGSLIRQHKSIARRGHFEGHHIASHSFSHPDLTTLSAADLNNEIEWTETEIQSVVGLRPRFFRPPYGSLNQAVFDRLARAGYRVIMWSNGGDTNDWRESVTATGIVQQYRTQLVGPSTRSFITLQHDINRKSASVVAQVHVQARINGFTPVPMYLCLNEFAYRQ